jgi:hypothetical protein
MKYIKKLDMLRREFERPGRRWSTELDRLMLAEVMLSDINRHFTSSAIDGDKAEALGLPPQTHISPSNRGPQYWRDNEGKWDPRDGIPARGPVKPARPDHLCEWPEGCTRNVAWLHGNRRFCAEHRHQMRLQRQRDRRAEAKINPPLNEDTMTGTFHFSRYTLIDGIYLCTGVMQPSEGAARRRDLVYVSDDVRELYEEGGEDAIQAFSAAIIAYLSEQSDTLPTPAMHARDFLGLIQEIQAGD